MINKVKCILLLLFTTVQLFYAVSGENLSTTPKDGGDGGSTEKKPIQPVKENTSPSSKESSSMSSRENSRRSSKKKSKLSSKLNSTLPSNDIDSYSQPYCSTTSLSVRKREFDYTWKIENLMDILEVYETQRFLEFETNDVEFNGDIIKGNWAFKLTNTKKFGFIAVYATHTIDDPKSISKKLIQVTLKYSTKLYRGSPFYTKITLIGTERGSKRSQKRKRHQLESESESEDSLKFSDDFNTDREETPSTVFEFPIFNVFEEGIERSSKITQAEDLKLRFDIEVFYPEIKKEVSKSCAGLE